MTGRNLTLMSDLYQLTMMNGYLRYGMKNKTAVFDLFFRKNKALSQYALVAGLEQAAEYVRGLRFEQEDIAYLRSLNTFDSEFLDYLKGFAFTGDIYAMKEGTPAFPNEPLLIVKAPIIEAQFIETALLTIINHQTLIATKASRVVRAAQGDAVLEFGLRRAQGPDAGIYGARAAMIGGCSATSNVIAGQMFGVPVRGTHSHSWVMSFDSELDAFRAYAHVFPDSCLLLVDTYHTIESGVPNAIRVFKELMAKGYKPLGIRLDSGDLAYLSKKARKMLDDAGCQEAKIFASSDLDEELIQDMKLQGARIDVWGVGTKLITSEDNPALGGVYKLAALGENGGALTPKLKISDNVQKITDPGFKKVIRFFDKSSGKALADLIALKDEYFDESIELEIFDPLETWKKMKLTNYTIKELLIPVFENGKQVYASPAVSEIAQYAKQNLDTFYDEYKRLKNPHLYKTDLSAKLYGLKQELIRQLSRQNNM